MTDYLSVIEILTIHDDQIERYGGGIAACWKPRFSGHRPAIMPI